MHTGVQDGRASVRSVTVGYCTTQPKQVSTNTYRHSDNTTMQQQARHRQSQDKEHDEADTYLATRRLAAETVEVARATITQASHQTEQLENADRLADHNAYLLDKSARLLRGMTWSGWVANMLSKDVKVEDYVGNNGTSSSNSRNQSAARMSGKDPSAMMQPPSADAYAHLPPQFQPAAQAVVNYRCNLAVLAQCQTPQQVEACSSTCMELSNAVRKELRKAVGDGGGNGFLDMEEGRDREACEKLLKDLEEADQVKKRLVVAATAQRPQQQQQQQQQQSKQGGNSNGNAHNRAARAPITPHNSLAVGNGTANSSATAAKISQQDEHLDALSQNLTELQGIGEALNTTFQHQSGLLDSIHDKTDDLTDKTKVVRRKADRIVHRSKWIKNRPELVAWMTIRHVRSGLYLCAAGDGGIKLGGFGGSDIQAAIFGKWRRKDSSVVGIQSKLTRNYVGQTMLGYLACSSSSYGRAQEWEIDHDDDNNTGAGKGTAIMCVGANWGNGGWLEVNSTDGSVSIGGSGTEAKKKAALWSITILDDDDGNVATNAKR